VYEWLKESLKLLDTELVTDLFEDALTDADVLVGFSI
jgi:hypothetical protein